MASQPAKTDETNGFRFDIVRLLMYIALTGYAFLSILPLYYMFSTSIMTLGEAQSGRFWPRQLDFQYDITPCILITTDTFINEDGATVTETRMVMDISEEVASEQRYGLRSDARSASIQNRVERFRIPFFSN